MAAGRIGQGGEHVAAVGVVNYDDRKVAEFQTTHGLGAQFGVGDEFGRRDVA